MNWTEPKDDEKRLRKSAGGNAGLRRASGNRRETRAQTLYEKHRWFDFREARKLTVFNRAVDRLRVYPLCRDVNLATEGGHMPMAIPQREGSYEGQGRLTLQGSNETICVAYDLDEYWDYVPYPESREVPLCQTIIGTIEPVPDVLHAPSGPHTLELADGRSLDCFVRNTNGAVQCQDHR